MLFCTPHGIRRQFWQGVHFYPADVRRQTEKVSGEADSLYSIICPIFCFENRFC